MKRCQPLLLLTVEICTLSDTSQKMVYQGVWSLFWTADSVAGSLPRSAIPSDVSSSERLTNIFSACLILKLHIHTRAKVEDSLTVDRIGSWLNVDGLD
jgi:hypothetical protein